LGDLGDETDKLDAVMRAVMDKSTAWVMKCRADRNCGGDYTGKAAEIMG
jgi:hypothetical protein